MLTNQDKAYLKAQMDKGLSYDDAFKLLKSVKAKVTATTTPTTATAENLTGTAWAKDTPAPEGYKAKSNVWGETGLVKETFGDKVVGGVSDFAAQTGVGQIGNIGSVAEAGGKLLQKASDYFPSLWGLGDAAAWAADKAGGWISEQGKSLKEDFGTRVPTGVAGKVGDVTADLAMGGLLLANPLSSGLRTIGAGGAAAAGGGEVSQLVAAGLASSPLDTALIRGELTGELPTGYELLTNAAFDAAFPILGALLTSGKGLASSLWETYKTAGQSPAVNHALKVAEASPAKSKEFRSMVEQYLEHAQRPVEVKSPLAIKAEEVINDYENVLVKEQRSVGSALSNEVAKSQKQFAPQTPYEMFKKFLQGIDVGVEAKYYKGADAIGEADALKLVDDSEEAMVKNALNDEMAATVSYLEPYAKSYKQLIQRVKGFDGLDLRSAVAKAKNTTSKVAQSFYERFKGLDGVVEEYKQVNPMFSGSTDDLFDEIKSYSKAKKLKVASGVRSADELNFDDSIIQFTKDDQNVLSGVFERLKAKAERGENLTLTDVWNLARSLEALSGIVPRNAASPVTEAALTPIKALDTFVRKGLEDNLSDAGKQLYMQYARLAPARAILSKSIGEFGEGGEALLNAAFGSSSKGGRAIEALTRLGELTKKNYAEDIQQAAAAEAYAGNQKVASIVRGLSLKGSAYGALEDALMNKKRLLAKLDAVIAGEAEKLHVRSSDLAEAIRATLKMLGLDILNN